MKKKKLLNITIISSLLFFSACSNQEKKIKSPEVSIYNIMGIAEPIKNSNQNNINFHNEEVTQDIEYISYQQQPQPTPARYEYISYRQHQPIPNRYYTIKKVEHIAKKFLGIPYVWGATGPDKFDCSGFTQWVFRDVGINIPRVSRDQARVGEYVSFNNLQSGDMMFFDTHKKRTGRVSHVGIYLGNGNFIHASSAGKKVVIYNFNKKPFYKERFLWGRRVVNNDFRYASN